MPVGGGRSALRASLLEAARTLLPMCFPAPAFVQAAQPGVRYSEVERAVEQESVSLAAAVVAPLSMVLFGALSAAANSPLGGGGGGGAGTAAGAAGAPLLSGGAVFWAQVGLGAAGVASALWLAFVATGRIRSLLGGAGAAAAGGTPRLSLTERIEQAAAASASNGTAAASSSVVRTPAAAEVPPKKALRGGGAVAGPAEADDGGNGAAAKSGGPTD